MKSRILLTTLLAAAAGACSNDDKKPDLDTTDKNFVEQAMTANLTEIQFGKLAAKRGTDNMVKQFGSRMQTEHGEAVTDLQKIDNNYDNITAPSSSSDTSSVKDMDAEHKQTYMMLNQTSGGSDFDSMYVASQVSDHQKTIALFQTEIASGTRQEVKDYATKYLPHIQMHLATADSIAAALKAKHNHQNSGKTGG